LALHGERHPGYVLAVVVEEARPRLEGEVPRGLHRPAHEPSQTDERAKGPLDGEHGHGRHRSPVSRRGCGSLYPASSSLRRRATSCPAGIGLASGAPCPRAAGQGDLRHRAGRRPRALRGDRARDAAPSSARRLTRGVSRARRWRRRAARLPTFASAICSAPTREQRALRRATSRASRSARRSPANRAP